jgi:hypothetical protein
MKNSVLIWATSAAGLVAAILVTLFTTHPSGGASSPLIILATAAGIGVGLISLAATILDLRRQRRRDAYRSRIGDIISNIDVDPEDASSVAAFDPEEVRVANYVRQRDAAERELAPYLSANPRRAKRLINHERLYARISEQRSIFGGDPELSYDHLDKWVLIVEDWPRLGAALTRDPEIIVQLETAQGIAFLQTALDAAIPGVKASEPLLKVIAKAPKLSPVLARLVRFEPAQKPPALIPLPSPPPPPQPYPAPH